MTRSLSLLPVLPRREEELPFRGLLASQLECIDCQYRHPVRYDLFDSLSLSFPKQAWVSAYFFIYFFFLVKKIIFSNLKGISPFKMHKIIFFPENLKKI